MNPDATYFPTGRMDCGRVEREEIAEHYLHGTLAEPERDAFEAHYFECSRCFDQLRALQAVKDELQQAGGALAVPTTRWRFGWPAAAALAAVMFGIVAVGSVVWVRRSNPAVQTTAVPGARMRPEQAPTPAAIAPPADSTLDQLARIDPPRYTGARLRTVPDEATARFQRGMERYQQADYAGALADLRAAAERSPDAAHIQFFVGICQLMLRQDDAGIGSLRATIALDDPRYIDEARLYLAKALLRRKDITGAERQLNAIVRLQGPRSEEARQLLTEIERLKDRPR